MAEWKQSIIIIYVTHDNNFNTLMKDENKLVSWNFTLNGTKLPSSLETNSGYKYISHSSSVFNNVQQ